MSGVCRLDSRRYRFPTEAEWEYACRAGTTTPFAFSAGLSTLQANFDGRDASGAGPHRAATTPVGMFQPNAWGLFDLHGNVWEWCTDWYGEYPTDNVTDPQGLEFGDFRVLRGGSWSNPRSSCRPACRYRFAPADRHPDFGFRVCLAAD